MGTVTRMELRKIADLTPYEHNAKLHPPEQIEKLRRSFREFGMIVPVGIDGEGRVIYGHGRLMAARAEGWTEVPTVIIENLTDEQRQAFVHADNLLGATGYDKETLLSEARALHAAGFDVTLVGFEAAGIDLGEIVTTLSPPPFWRTTTSRSCRKNRLRGAASSGSSVTISLCAATAAILKTSANLCQARKLSFCLRIHHMGLTTAANLKAEATERAAQINTGGNHMMHQTGTKHDRMRMSLI